MHEKEVGRIVLLTLNLRYASRHRHGRYARRTDERVDGAATELVHQLCGQQTAASRNAEGGKAANDDEDGLNTQEISGRGGRTNRNTQEDGDNVHQLVLRRLGETLGHAAHIEQITEHETADERQRIGHNKTYHTGYDDGEKDLFLHRNLAESRHLDGALLGSGQHTHEGRLDHRNERHVAVCGNSDRTQQSGSQGLGDQNRRRTVSATDDTDGCRLLRGKERRQQGKTKGDKHAKLCACADEQALGVGDQGGEIGHSADTDKDQAGIYTQLYTEIQKVEESAVVEDQTEVNLVGNKIIQMEQICTGQVGEQHTHGDRQQEQRLKLFDNGEIHKDAHDGEHHKLLPARGVKRPACARQIKKTLPCTGLGKEHLPYTRTREEID